MSSKLWSQLYDSPTKGMKVEDLMGLPQKKFFWFLFRCCNYCNLHCEHCITLDRLPIKPDSQFWDRREKYEVNISEIELFCERFKGVGKRQYHRLTGGEPTAMPPEKISEIVETLISYDRPLISIITNGFNLMGIDKNTIRKISHITLNDHGINHNHILNCQKYLQGFYNGKIQLLSHIYHYDYTKISYGQKYDLCRSRFETLTVYKGTVYPCCVMPWLRKQTVNKQITIELEKAGWSLDNPNLLKTIRNWRTTIPPYVVRQCKTDCWAPNLVKGNPHFTRITLKPNDVIAKAQR